MNQQVVRNGQQSSRQYFVSLERLPDHFLIPADLQSRFGYDSNRKGLVFEGWMCKAAYDRLRHISNDYQYQRSLERLFQMAVPEEDTRAPRGFGLAVAAGAVAAALATVLGVLHFRHQSH